ncbi:MAG: hypothetical protein KF889_28260 [Alphaproteobacteria bacterium]|nr:hypothetical protein [Alphaproteobacteria bacterium]MCW5743850.1 hypothetical protein [Alphaproteobacteria bacterium]
MAPALTELERSWPIKLAVPIPEGGFGWRFPYLLHAARDRGSRRHWQDADALVFAFYDPADRARFADWMVESEVDWRCPPEWPQIAPAEPLPIEPGIVPASPAAAPRIDALAMEDWVRGAVHRGLARRVIKAYLARYRHDGQAAALHGAMDALGAERPDLAPGELADRAGAIVQWTRRRHRAWFRAKLAAMKRDAAMR